MLENPKKINLSKSGYYNNMMKNNSGMASKRALIKSASGSKVPK